MMTSIGYEDFQDYMDYLLTSFKNLPTKVLVVHGCYIELPELSIWSQGPQVTQSYKSQIRNTNGHRAGDSNQSAASGL